MDFTEEHEKKNPIVRMLNYNDLVEKDDTGDTRLLTKFDGKMIRNKYMRKTMEHVYNRSKAFYEVWVGSLRAFRNGMEHFNESLIEKHCIDREKGMVILHSVSIWMSLGMIVCIMGFRLIQNILCFFLFLNFI